MPITHAPNSEPTNLRKSQLSKLEALLREAPITYAGLSEAMGLKDSSVRRYLQLLRNQGLPVRIAGWEKPKLYNCRPKFTLGREPDAPRPKSGDEETEAVADAALDALIERDVLRKLAKIRPRRDPIITMFFGEYQRGI